MIVPPRIELPARNRLGNSNHRSSGRFPKASSHPPSVTGAIALGLPGPQNSAETGKWTGANTMGDPHLSPVDGHASDALMFSLVDGYVFASWPGANGAVRLGTYAQVRE